MQRGRESSVARDRTLATAAGVPKRRRRAPHATGPGRSARLTESSGAPCGTRDADLRAPLLRAGLALRAVPALRAVLLRALVRAALRAVVLRAVVLRAAVLRAVVLRAPSSRRRPPCGRWSSSAPSSSYERCAFAVLFRAAPLRAVVFFRRRRLLAALAVVFLRAVVLRAAVFVRAVVFLRAVDPCAPWSSVPSASCERSSSSQRSSSELPTFSWQPSSSSPRLLLDAGLAGRRRARRRALGGATRAGA